MLNECIPIDFDIVCVYHCSFRVHHDYMYFARHVTLTVQSGVCWLWLYIRICVFISVSRRFSFGAQLIFINRFTSSSWISFMVFMFSPSIMFNVYIYCVSIYQWNSKMIIYITILYTLCEFRFVVNHSHWLFDWLIY